MPKLIKKFLLICRVNKGLKKVFFRDQGFLEFTSFVMTDTSSDVEVQVRSCWPAGSLSLSLVLAELSLMIDSEAGAFKSPF